MKLHALFAAFATLITGACAVPTSSLSESDAPRPAGATAQTADGRDNGPLWRSDGGGFLPASGNVDPSVPCQLISLSLRLDRSAPEPPAPKLIGSPFRCWTSSTYLGYLRGTLFIEGLDVHGTRLFVVTGTNPLHQDIEIPPPASGGAMTWHSFDTPLPVVNVLISAPITPSLTHLRWYGVDEHDQPRLLGETNWTGAG